MAEASAHNPELWIECKSVCRDCPEIPGSRSLKKSCLHKWRRLIESSVSVETGKVPFDTPEVCVSLGATVSQHLDSEGKRPSVQLFSEKPPVKIGMIAVQVADH